MSNSSKSVGLSDNSETEVAYAITLLRALPKFRGYEFNPQTVIKAVNYFHGLGYKKSLQILRKYCDFFKPMDSPDSLLSVVRILFIFKGIGLEHLLGPLPQQLFPLTPFHIHRDIPFLFIKGDFFFGEPLTLEHIESQEHEFDIRPTPLLPDDNPIASVDELLELENMRNKINSRPGLPNMLRLQALLAVSNVYPISDSDKDELLSSATNDENWRRHRQAFAALNISWNPRTNEYERGKSSPEK